MREGATPRFALSLALVSMVVVLYVSLVTLGQGKQSAVEARLAELVALSEAKALPCSALVALCVAEAHGDSVRSDFELASLLAKELNGKASVTAVRGAISRIYADEIQRNLVLDLWEMNRERWRRLAAEYEDS